MVIHQRCIHISICVEFLTCHWDRYYQIMSCCRASVSFSYLFWSHEKTSYNVITNKVKSYTVSLLDLMNKCREIYKIMIDEHQSYHHKYRNAQLEIINWHIKENSSWAILSSQMSNYNQIKGWTASKIFHTFGKGCTILWRAFQVACMNCPC